MTSLNPVLPSASRLPNPCACTRGWGAKSAARGEKMLDQVRIPGRKRCSRAIPTSSPAACARG
nr:Uncharacterised protein [Klebsiella pneumoniae]